jgi:hypothetical protein
VVKRCCKVSCVTVKDEAKNHLGIVKDVEKKWDCQKCCIESCGFVKDVKKNYVWLPKVLQNIMWDCQRCCKESCVIVKDVAKNHLRCHLPLLAGRSIGCHHVIPQQVHFLVPERHCSLVIKGQSHKIGEGSKKFNWIDKKFLSFKL